MMRKPSSKGSLGTGVCGFEGARVSRKRSSLFADWGQGRPAPRPVLCRTGWIACALLLPAWTGAAGQASEDSRSQASAALSAKVIAWANANLASYKQAIDYSKNGPPPQVPVPPLVDPPCRACDAADTPTPGEDQADLYLTITVQQAAQ